MVAVLKGPIGGAATPSDRPDGIMTSFKSSPFSSSPSTVEVDDTPSEDQRKVGVDEQSDRPCPAVPLSLEKFPAKLKEELVFAAWDYELDAQGRWTKVSRYCLMSHMTWVRFGATDSTLKKSLKRGILSLATCARRRGFLVRGAYPRAFCIFRGCHLVQDSQRLFG